MNQMLRRLLVIILAFLVGGCGTTTILDKHKELMASQKDKKYYVTATPIQYADSRDWSLSMTCFSGRGDSFWKEARSSEYYQTWGGWTQGDAEEYAIQGCEKHYGKSCVILLTNEIKRCAATFDIAYEKEKEKQRILQKERREIAEVKRKEEENRKTEQMKNTCLSFGFTINSPQLSECVMELYKTTAQVEAIRRAGESQVQATNAAAEETARLLQFQQGMELLKQSNQMLNPSQQNRMTTNCRYNTIMKTISCN